MSSFPETIYVTFGAENITKMAQMQTENDICGCSFIFLEET